MTDDRRATLETAHRLASEYLDTLPHRRVGPLSTAAELRERLGGRLGEEGVPASEVLDILGREAERGHMASSGPRFFGFVVGGTHPVAIGADWLTCAWDQNAGLFVLSPIASVVEEVAGDWVIDLLGLPARSSVGFVTGCQMANFTALAAARHAVLRRAGWDVEADGLQGAPRLRVIVGEEAHATIFTALRMLGIGARSVEVAAADDQGRLDPASLESLLSNHDGRPTIICAQAGNVNSGAFDPFERIVELARGTGAWVHVDAAFGLWARASEKYRHLAKGIEGADSWATDAHKWLNVPQDSGLVIVADSAAHRAAMTVDASYLQKSNEERDEIDWVPDFSRRARGVAVWATLRHLGRRGVAELVERCCHHARTMAELLDRDPRVTVRNDVVLNQALIRFESPGHDPDDLTLRVIRRVQADGVCWLGGSRWKGAGVMRISVSNWSTSEEDVRRSAESILEALDRETAS